MKSARDLVGKPVGIKEEFISVNEQNALLEYVKSEKAAWETYLPEDNVWYARMINPSGMPPEIVQIMGWIRERAAETIKADYEITDPVYADTLQLVRWRVGDQQAPHADCEEPDGRPNPFPWRAFASIIYLNDDYEGGEIHFPTLGLRPKLKPRMLAYFPSTRDYLHGVTRVNAGVRYTHSCFYTFDQSRHDQLPV